MTTETRACRFKATEFNSDDLEHMVQALSAYGVKIKCDMSRSRRSAIIVVETPSNTFDAKLARTRGAGRRHIPITPPNDSEISLDMTCEDFLAWLDDHTSEEAMRALGIDSPSLYYRRLRTIREKVAKAKRVNPSRVKRDLPAFVPKLRDLNF